MGVTRRWLALLLLALAATAPATLHAEDASTLKARARIKKARGLYEAGKFEAAVKEYLAAYRLIQLADILFNIGQIYEVKDDSQKALDFYLKYLGADPDGRLKGEAQKRIVAVGEKCLPDDLHEKYRAARALRDAAAGEEQTALDARWTTFYGKLVEGDASIVEDLDALALKTKKKAMVKLPPPDDDEQRVVAHAPPPRPKKRWHPAPLPPLPPYAKKWWFWTAVGGGAAVIVLSVGLGVGLGGQSDPVPSIGVLR